MEKEIATEKLATKQLYSLLGKERVTTYLKLYHEILKLERIPPSKPLDFPTKQLGKLDPIFGEFQKEGWLTEEFLSGLRTCIVSVCAKNKLPTFQSDRLKRQAGLQKKPGQPGLHKEHNALDFLICAIAHDLSYFHDGPHHRLVSEFLVEQGICNVSTPNVQKIYERSKDSHERFLALLLHVGTKKLEQYAPIQGIKDGFLFHLFQTLK